MFGNMFWNKCKRGGGSGQHQVRTLLLDNTFVWSCIHNLWYEHVFEKIRFISRYGLRLGNRLLLLLLVVCLCCFWLWLDLCLLPGLFCWTLGFQANFQTRSQALPEEPLLPSSQLLGWRMTYGKNERWKFDIGKRSWAKCKRTRTKSIGPNAVQLLASLEKKRV